MLTTTSSTRLEREPSDDAVPQSLYMVMTNAQAVEELVRLFKLWQLDQSVTFERGLAPLKEVFGLLRSIRRWGPEDRVRESGLLDQWAEDVQVAGVQGVSRVEIELWHRQEATARRAAQDEVDINRSRVLVEASSRPLTCRISPTTASSLRSRSRASNRSSMTVHPPSTC